MSNRTRRPSDAAQAHFRREAEAAGRRATIKRAASFAMHAMLAVAIVGVVKHAVKA